jgi:hypothetical protein
MFFRASHYILNRFSFFHRALLASVLLDLRKIVNIYRFAVNFWAVRADIEREDGISVSLSNVVRKAKNLLFVRYSNIISIQNNLFGPLFQNQSLIGAKEFLSVLVLFVRQLILTELWIFHQSASGACFYRKSILFACLPAATLILKQKGRALLTLPE